MCRSTLTGNRTVAPILDRAAAAFELREAPTHAQVSNRDKGANRGRSFFTKSGKNVLHSRPAHTHHMQACDVITPVVHVT